MVWQQLIDQERVVRALKGLIDQERVPHALLFYGPIGVGKRATALAFAQALQCETGSSDPCGQCNPCQKVGRLIHPDVQVLFPYPNDIGAEDINNRLERLRENPYLPIDYVRLPVQGSGAKAANKQAIYTVARINEELRRSMSFKPVEGRFKIAILFDVERFRQEAANAFLKLLEEPGPQTVFILIADRTDRLLPTIVSRCQLLRFEPLQAEAISGALETRQELPPERAKMLARMANGSYQRALDLAANEDLQANRQMVIDFYRLSYSMNVDKLSDLIGDMQSIGREQLKAVLGLMLGFMRDLMLFKESQSPDALLINQDQRETIEKFCSNLPDADIETMIGLVEEAQELVTRNVHVPLTLTVLAQQLRRAMKGLPVPSLFVPLVGEDSLGMPSA